MNAIGNEYRQIGGSYTVMHHTQYLESLVSTGKLDAGKLDASITYHDPCYLGRHNGVYDAPRNVLRVLGNELLEMDRSRENAFCCGAGGAQFWKEEEPGTERISENRFDEVKQRLSSATHQKTLAVGCPFCKSMLSSTPGKSDADGIAIKDVAEL
ncbi:iron-sulfur-binding reductase, partial [mine drainage metagenome]